MRHFPRKSLPAADSRPLANSRAKILLRYLVISFENTIPFQGPWQKVRLVGPAGFYFSQPTPRFRLSERPAPRDLLSALHEQDRVLSEDDYSREK